jgi:hypothetical protein
MVCVGGALAPIRADAIAGKPAPTKSPPTNAVYALQLDIANFFNSIHRPTLFRLIQARLLRAVRRQGLAADEARALQTHIRALLSADPTVGVRRKGSPRLFEQVPPHKRLGAMGGNTGLPIGNLTSQFFANVYLNELDQFVKHTLKARCYVRYVDDFVLLHRDPEQLRLWRCEIERFLAQRLRLKFRDRAEPKPVSAGVDFLGYIVRPFYKLVRRRVVRHLFAHLAEFERKHVRADAQHFALRLPAAERDLLRARLASFLGHLRHANSFALWQQTLSRFPWLRLIFDLPEQGGNVPSPLSRLPTVGAAIGAKAPPTGDEEFVGGAIAPIRADAIAGKPAPTKPAINAIKLRPAWEPASVSGLAGQYRYFAEQYPASCVLMQVGKHWLVSGASAARAARWIPRGAARVHRPGLGACVELPAHQLAALRRKLKRAGIAHVLAGQTGHFKTGFKRRAMLLIWRSLAEHEPKEPVGAALAAMPFAAKAAPTNAATFLSST